MDTLRRWLGENVADTRRPDGPEGRLYEVAFAQVWDEILAQIARHRRWSLVHRDEELGLISVECTSLVLRMVDDLTIWVGLDPNALTRVDALSRARVGKGDLGVNRRRLVRLFRALDDRFGPRARLLDPGRTASGGAGREPDRPPSA